MIRDRIARVLRHFRARIPTGVTDAPRRSSAPLHGVGATHRTVLTPPEIEHGASTVRTGDDWAQAFWIGEFPDAPPDGLLESLYAAAETANTDIAIHLVPRDTRATLDALENRLEDLEADYDYLLGHGRAGARGVRSDLQAHRELYDVLRNTPMQAFDVSMYLSVRGPAPDELGDDAVVDAARRAPANLVPLSARWAQLDALTSASPIGMDALDRTQGTTTPMLGGAVGALFPFLAGSFAEPGVEFGAYALNESPLILDRFNRETGSCMMVIGTLGAGKSFSTKLTLLRRAMYDGETVLVLLDPLRGFADLNAVLGGERVTVGGRRGLNPLDLEPTPDAVLAAVPDLDPWAEQIAWVLSFFESFFDAVATNPLGSRKQTLRRAVQATYERAGITSDPSTHGRDSPTITDLIAVLEALLDGPGEFGYGSAGERAAVAADAESLLKELRPSFRPGGDLAHLAAPTELALDAPVVYLDLTQGEGVRGRTETSLTMQVLFNAVYERAKTTDARVIFAIDEAHYLLNDATSLGFLETAVRHSRHYDLSVQFITQTGGEFALTPEARTIADLCSIVLIHRVNEQAEKLAEWFGLTDREAHWIRTAKAGSAAEGFSEALLGIDEVGWFPLRVRASPAEAAAIEGGGHSSGPRSTANGDGGPTGGGDSGHDGSA